MSYTKNEQRLREVIKALEKDLAQVKKDRELFRQYFIQNFRCAVDLLGENKTWNMQYVVKTLAEQMTKFERFYWGTW